MSATTRPYYVRIGTGGEVLCESLGLNPMTLTRESFGVDALVMEQHRVRGAWAADLAHDTAVRFYRLTEEDTLEQLFMGRVVSPQEVEEAARRRRMIRVHGVGQLARETWFHRGQWTPTDVGGVGNPAPNVSGDECSMYYGANYLEFAGTLRKRTGRQRVDMAFAEAIDNLKRVAARVAAPNVWVPTLASNYFGPASQVPEPQSSLQPTTNYLDWLIKLARPVPDAFLAWDYSGTNPACRVGRYGDQAAVSLPSGWPTLARGLVREIDKEVSSFWVFQNAADGEPENGIGYQLRLQLARWPLTGAASPLDRRTRLLSFPDDGSPIPNATTVAAFLGPTLLAPLTQGSAALMGQAWRWCAPGSVLTVGGLRYNVQATTLNLASESLSVSLGLPQHLGVQDLEELALWLNRWRRTQVA